MKMILLMKIIIKSSLRKYISKIKIKKINKIICNKINLVVKIIYKIFKDMIRINK